MKFLIIWLTLLLPVILFSQEGFKVIRKAEKQIEKGNYKKALKLLDRADSMNYGFCGNAWIDAENAIALNRIKIIAAKGESLKAANMLNESYIYHNSVDIDSLKIAYYLDTLKKDVIKKEIDSCINSIVSIDSIDFFSELTLSVNFSNKPFSISYQVLNNIRKEMYVQQNGNSDEQLINNFKATLRRQPFYLLLQE